MKCQISSMDMVYESMNMILDDSDVVWKLKLSFNVDEMWKSCWSNVQNKTAAMSVTKKTSGHAIAFFWQSDPHTSKKERIPGTTLLNIYIKTD